MIRIAPSILAADFSRLKEEIQIVQQAGADEIHLDIMDGHFVPNLTIGPALIESIRKVTDLCFWSHLMIERPDQYIPVFHKAGVGGITVHQENGIPLTELAEQIHDLGIQAGVTINPETPVETILDVLPHFQRVLIMTVHPGFGGQKFMPEAVLKIRQIHDAIQKLESPPIIEVDGGIGPQTVPEVVKAGARCLIAGSSIFRTPDPAEALKKMRAQAEALLV